MSELKDRFVYHPPKNDQVKRYQQIRDAGYSMVLTLEVLVPESRERTIALTKLEEVVMWANAAIARNE